MHDVREQLRQVRDAALDALQAYYKELGLTRIRVPLVVPITGACENVATLYRLPGRPGRYLAQTGQLSLEVELENHTGVYCITSSFRADEPDDRHLNEFCLIEEEFSVVSAGLEARSYDVQEMMEVLQVRITKALCAMLSGVLSAVNDARPTGDFIHLEHALESASGESGWPRITYADAIVMLNSTDQFEHLSFGADLGAEHEKALLSIVSADRGQAPTPLFVTHFPEAIKFFNMKIDPAEPSVVLSTDLLLPTAGETVGAAVREDDSSTLVRRLEASSIIRDLTMYDQSSRNDFDPYLRLMSSGRVPAHAGYGIGLERVLQFILRRKDIRDVSEPFRLVRSLTNGTDNI